MCKSKIFAELLEIVSNETEVSREKILSDSKEIEVVDARSILIHLLYKEGLYPSEIASFINKTKRSVNQNLSSFSVRLDSGKMLGIILEKVRKKIGNKREMIHF